MKIDILTLFPEMFAPLGESIIGRAVKAGKVEISVVNIRDYSENKHKKCDDYPFGGGAGMVMTPQPVYSAINAVDPEHKARRIYMSPKGRKFTQDMVQELLSYGEILFLCGHYEGVDQRVLDMCIDEEMSLGDFVLTGGEIPAMAITDCICRYVDGVIAGESLEDESISSGALEYPQYTRPRVFMGAEVPEVLVSGNHSDVDKWRTEQSRILTEKKRPDLIEKMKAEHEMKLERAPFELIKSGYKSIEVRLYDKKRQKIKVGDRIKFIEKSSAETIRATVTEIKVFDNFSDLYRFYDKKLLGYLPEEEASSEDMNKYYTAEEQKKYKAVAIGLKR